MRDAPACASISSKWADSTSHVPPVLTKTWYHTGVFADRTRISTCFSREYYREPDQTDELLPDTVLQAGLSAEEAREACRALKGLMLRQEVYALDKSANEKNPYTVTEQNFTVKKIQDKGKNRHAVFVTHPREVLSRQYERNPANPRTSHAMTLEVDDFGNVLRSLAIAYGRREASTEPALTPADRAKQGAGHLVYTDSRQVPQNRCGFNKVFVGGIKVPLSKSYLGRKIIDPAIQTFVIFIFFFIFFLFLFSK